MRILVIEDDKPLAGFLRKGLQENGHAVDVSHEGDEGLYMARTGPYDVVILDVMLPGRSGFQIVKQLRSAGNDIPVLFLSAKDELEDRLAGLDLGGDDYLTKPFAFDEVLARLRALERRSGSEPKRELTCGDLALYPAKRRVVRAGETIALTPKEFQFLHLLLKRQGQVVTRTTIIEKLWDMNFDSFDNAVDVLVHRLRSKIDEPFDSPLIHTVRGVGYVARSSED